jgi:arabinofuranosyltransferase
MQRIRTASTPKIIFTALICLFFITLVKTAWITDDAAFTLRTVLNWLEGFGPIFNVYERVQVYTHPLWFLLLSFFSLIFRNVFYVAFFLSLIVTLLTVTFLYKKTAISMANAMIVGFVLLFSKAFIDFSSSGLENCLSHLLIVLSFTLAIQALQKSGLQRLCFVTLFLLMLNRHDLFLIVLPVFVYVFIKTKDLEKKSKQNAFIALLPLIVWTVFSIVYYGFPFPNTAYAKLGSEIPKLELYKQGLLYFWDSLHRDPLTLATIGCAIVLGFRQKGIQRIFAISILMYLVYIVNIGGDFMSGRFFTVPLIIAVVIIARTPLHQKHIFAFASVIALLGLFNVRSTVLSGPGYVEMEMKNRISDERGFYFQKFGMLPVKKIFSREYQLPQLPKLMTGCGQDGYESILNRMLVISKCGISDPLLARVPAFYNPEWRSGHYVRVVPEGYIASIERNGNFIADPQTHEYYDYIREITRAPLFLPSRLVKIAKINLGLVAKPNAEFYYQKPPEKYLHKGY